ncbi:MAG: phage tail assembly protein [Rhizobiales bacterium]|nr:phage tail assembly protein [Hyphomicrobiales bacterium]
MEKTVFKLDKPFDFNGQKIDGFKFKKPTVKDRLEISKLIDDLPEDMTFEASLEFDIKCLSYMTGKDRALFEAMDDDAFDETKKAGAVFMPKGWKDYLYQPAQSSPE